MDSARKKRRERRYGSDIWPTQFSGESETINQDLYRDGGHAIVDLRRMINNQEIDLANVRSAMLTLAKDDTLRRNLFRMVDSAPQRAADHDRWLVYLDEEKLQEHLGNLSEDKWENELRACRAFLQKCAKKLLERRIITQEHYDNMEFSILISKQGTQAQELHTDFDHDAILERQEELKATLVEQDMNNTEAEFYSRRQLPLGAIVSVQKHTTIDVHDCQHAPSDQPNGATYTRLQIPSGCACLLQPDTVHAGSSYAHDSLRFHIYFRGSGWGKVQDASVTTGKCDSPTNYTPDTNLLHITPSQSLRKRMTL